MIQIDTGAVDISIDVQIVDDSGLPVTGLAAATFPTVKYSKGTGNDATVSLSDLATLSTAHADGGVKERGEGVYRLDLPDAVASTAGVTTIRAEATDKRLIAPRIQVGLPSAIHDLVEQHLTEMFPVDVGSGLATVNVGNFTASEIPDAAAGATGGLAIVGSAMTLTSGERTTLAGVIWAVLTSALTTVGSIGKYIVDTISGSTTIQPLTNTVNDRVSATEIQAYYNETGFTIGPVAVTDADGDPVDISGYTSLRFVVETSIGQEDVFVTTSVTVSGADDNQWTVTGTSAITGTAPASYLWALRGISTGVNVVLGRGTLTVSPAAEQDS